VGRSDHIARQRAEHGRRAVAVLPIVYPKELLTALDLLAVEVWGPPGPPRGDAAGRIQTYVCAVVRNALAFLASGGARACDAVLFPHTCDSIQQLATLVHDLGGWDGPSFTFLHPKGTPRASARAFVLAELKALGARLAAFAGRPLDDDRLAAALRLHRDVDAERRALLDGRAGLALSDPELYALLRRGEWLWPEDHLAELRAARARAPLPADDGPRRRGLPLLVTGYVPEPSGFLEALDAAGAFVAADDYAAVGRRLASGRGGSPSGDPWEALADRFWSLPPCPTRGADQDVRMAHLVALAERSGARGVVVHGVKFCEPELFDVPAIQRTFAARGLPVLVLESELEARLSAQVTTRLEAFVELVAAREAA
jgi:benzoyl-CoA reductase/2-hydroxyglutaryl-CoA dehydratase subunit BcrC/BadD/HgdB